MIHSYPQVFQVGHKAIEGIFDGPVVLQEKVDGCVVPETPILCRDLVWRKAGELPVGCDIIGTTYLNGRTRLTPSVVIANVPVIKPCVRVTTDKGQLMASVDHPVWVRRQSSNNRSRWVPAEDLRLGQSISMVPMWEIDRSWESGYLAGQFDGEGSLVRYKAGSGSASANRRCLSYYQRISPSQEYVRSLLLQKGFALREDIRQRNPKWCEQWTAIIAGGWSEIIRFLGAIRPVRLIEHSESLWNMGCTNGLPKGTVLSVEGIGNQTVAGLSTSTETYIAGGFISHNSQFQFGVIDGALQCRSKGQQIIIGAQEGMFDKAVQTVQELQPLLSPDLVYRGEYLQKPHHNALAYTRVPARNIILYDISGNGDEAYWSYAQVRVEAERLGLDVVPQFFEGPVTDMAMFKELLARESILGGTKIEGVVVKNYAKFGQDKKVLMGKYVRAQFQELNADAQKRLAPKAGDIITQLIETYRLPARWQKAVQHLREAGALQQAPQDIGPLMKEVQADVLREEAETIKSALFKWAWPQIARAISHGLPDWYKEELAKLSFPDDTADGE